jgi:hypothetical protein
MYSNKHPTQVKRQVSLLPEALTCAFAILTVLLLLSACNTSYSTRSSSTSSTSSTSTSTSTGSPSSPGQEPASQSGTETGRQPSVSADNSTGNDTGNQSASTKQGNNQGPQDSNTTAGTKQESGGKTDEQILAEALDIFTAGPAPRQESDGDTSKDGVTAAETAAAGQAGKDAAESSRTAAEKSETLARELDKGLAEFDNMILGERQAAIEQENAEGGGGYGTGYYGDGDAPTQTAMIDKEMSPGGMQPGSGGGSKPPQPEAEIPRYEIPDDIPDSQDDDIIARQLREAAMKEPDPVLRDKLWAEYRKYKKDLQAGK